VVLSDGEFQEGMTWEACLAIPNKKLNKVFGFIDYNRLQVDGSVDKLNSLDPLKEKLQAFNWDVKVVSGHDFYALVDVLDNFSISRGIGMDI
jgi:transketolase